MSEYSEQIAEALARGAQIAVENRALAEAAEAVGDVAEARELREQAAELERRTKRAR